MMLGVADPTQQPGNHQNERSPSSPPPEVVDAEIVETSDTGTTGEQNPGELNREDRRPQPLDTEQQRQFQQFLEFQKFQEWQRQQGQEPGTTPSAGSSGMRPWWKRALRLLRFKFIRRLIYLAVAVLLVFAGINYTIDRYLGGGDQSSPGAPGNQNPGLSPVLPTDPKETIIGVYSKIAFTPEATCQLFDEPAGARFAADYGAPTCLAAAQRLHQQVTDPTKYKNNLDYGQGAVEIVEQRAAIYSCRMTVDGGPRLGAFGLTRTPNGGWIISGHRNEPADCR